MNLSKKQSTHFFLKNANFKRLYDKYCELKQKVKQANERTIEMDEFALEEMKKKKLHLKDQMAKMIDEYGEDNTAA